jgi:hypothetical protein
MVDVTPAAKQHRHSTACVSPADTLDIITLPTPASEKLSTKIEVVNLMSKVSVGHIRAATAKAIMKLIRSYTMFHCPKRLFIAYWQTMQMVQSSQESSQERVDHQYAVMLT